MAGVNGSTVPRRLVAARLIPDQDGPVGDLLRVLSQYVKHARFVRTGIADGEKNLFTTA